MKADLIELEKNLKTELLKSNFDCGQLEKLKNTPGIQRHLSLVSIIERHQQSLEFEAAQKKADNESFLTKLLLTIGLGP